MNIYISSRAGGIDLIRRISTKERLSLVRRFLSHNMIGFDSGYIVPVTERERDRERVVSEEKCSLCHRNSHFKIIHETRGARMDTGECISPCERDNAFCFKCVSKMICTQYKTRCPMCKMRYSIADIIFQTAKGT